MSERAEYPTDGSRPYVCNACGASGVKLWRDSNTLACWCALFCGACAAKRTGDAEPDEDGKTWPIPFGVDFWPTDQVGVKTAAGRSMSTETVAFATVGTIVGRGGGIVLCERHRSLLDEVLSADGYALIAKVITGGGA